MDDCQCLGDYLRQQRQDRGLSLDDIAARTKVKLSHLQALEDGDYEQLPAETYLRGFLVSYAETLGVPFPRIFELYRSERPAQPQTAWALARPELHGTASAASILKLMVALLLLAAVAGSAIWWLTKGGDSPSATIVESAAETSLLAPAEQDEPSLTDNMALLREPEPPAAAATAGSSAASPQEQPLRQVVPPIALPEDMALQALEPVAVTVSVDGRPVQTYTLEAGSLLRWRVQKSVDLRIDPPAAARVSIGATEVTFDVSGRFALPAVED